jgi:Holliday junction resolvase-like predicted endonuclease
MTKQSAKKLKPEYQAGGSKRQVILDKAVHYLQQPGLQANKHMFCIDILKMTETEYLEALNKATNGAMVRDLWN